MLRNTRSMSRRVATPRRVPTPGPRALDPGRSPDSRPRRDPHDRDATRGVGEIARGRFPLDRRRIANTVDVAIFSHMYHEIENPYKFLYRLQPALAPGARVGIIDMDRPTQRHGTLPALLRCELAALGYRQLDFALLVPADGYLAVFTPPETLPPAGAIKPCRQ